MADQLSAPSFTDIALEFPSVYLRKLQRKADWGSEETLIHERVGVVASLVFDRETYPFSVFLVTTDEELHRVIIGMNGGRQSLSADSSFLMMHPDDLAAAGLEATHTPGEGMTACHHANLLHYDIEASDQEIKMLCKHLIQQQRKVHYFSRGRTKLLVSPAEAIKCRAAVKDSMGCLSVICK